jgi:hypothetical protein
MKFFARAALLSLVFTALACAAERMTGLSKNSPFMPVASAAASQDTANERIEFAGISSVGNKTDLIFYDKTAKKSHWIAKGETKEGIEVLNFDEPREQAVVKVNGVEKTLSLRKRAAAPVGPRAVTTLPAASGFSTPFPVTNPTAAVQRFQPLPASNASSSTAQTGAAGVAAAQAAQPAPPATPEAQAQVKAETEARMLVSDLLEIGMAQRKAYEEAQRRAAEGNSSNATPPSLPQAPLGNPPTQPRP